MGAEWFLWVNWFFIRTLREPPKPPTHFLLLLCFLTANGMVRENKIIHSFLISSLCLPASFLCSPTVVLPHGAGEQRPLREHGGQQSAHHQLEPQTGLQVPVQAHSGLVRMLPERLQALGLPPLPGSASIAYLPSTRCDVLSDIFSRCFQRVLKLWEEKTQSKTSCKLFIFWEESLGKEFIDPPAGKLIRYSSSTNRGNERTSRVCSHLIVCFLL